ncbi:MAG: site-specific integrase [Dysgonomonas sp.]
MKYTFKISFFLKKSIVRKNGKSPIIVRITLNGEKVEFSSKLSIIASKWNVDTGEAEGNSDEATALNYDLNSIRMTIYTYYRNLSEKCEIITADKLRRMYTQTKIYPQTLLTLFKKHNDDELKLVGYVRVMDTYKKYELAYRRVQEFMLLKYSKNDIYLDNLNLQFINDYEIYLLSDCKLGINMTAKMIQFLKEVANLARNLGIINFDPFYLHKTKWEKTKIEYLTKYEIKQIIEKEIIIRRLDVVRDIFLFSIFTGLSYIDIRNLTVNHIHEQYNGSCWIITSRQKTNNSVELPLLDIPKRIIDKYKNERTDSRLLPVMSNQKMNAYLKELADICKIKKRLTFHVARHNETPYRLLSSILHDVRFLIGNDLETSLVLRSA